MVSFFRRKKDKGAAAGKAGETRKGGLDIEALAAAFPKPPGAVADDDDRARIDADGGAENNAGADEARTITAHDVAAAPEAAGADAAVLDDSAPAEPAPPAPGDRKRTRRKSRPQRPDRQPSSACK